MLAKRNAPDFETSVDYGCRLTHPTQAEAISVVNCGLALAAHFGDGRLGADETLGKGLET